jgi:hypothetical protein
LLDLPQSETDEVVFGPRDTAAEIAETKKAIAEAEAELTAAESAAIG